ncbi:retrovirus-related pol polyprotein from transposon TNT 1-94 [Tanacetum coccineum]
MKAVFNQMETEVAKCSVDKKYFEIEKKELCLDNDRFLEHIICQDVVNTIMHANDHSDNVLHENNNSLEHDNSALELQKLVAVTPINMDRKVRFAESSDTSKDKTQKQVQPQDKQTINNAMSPSTGVSSSTEASGLKPWSNIKKDKITQTSSSNKKKNKVEFQPRIAKSSLNNVNRVSNTVCNESVKHSMLNANSELICATFYECMFDAIHDLCVSDYLNDVNAHVKSKYVKSRNAKSKKKKMWKANGKVYTKVGYIWKPTRQTFTIDEYTCPLTRIISTKVMPPRKSISTTPVKQTQPSSNKSGKLKDIKHVGSSSQSKTVGRTNRTLVPGLGLLQAYDRAALLAHQLRLVRGLPKLKFEKDHLCPACSVGKSKKSSHKPKADNTNQEKLYLLHMNLYGPMRVESIIRKKYIMFIVDDYSRFKWVKFLRSNDEAPEVIIKFLKQIQVHLNATV